MSGYFLATPTPREIDLWLHVQMQVVPFGGGSSLGVSPPRLGLLSTLTSLEPTVLNGEGGHKEHLWCLAPGLLGHIGPSLSRYMLNAFEIPAP